MVKKKKIYERTDGKYSGFIGYAFSVATKQLHHCNAKHHSQYVNEEPYCALTKLIYGN